MKSITKTVMVIALLLSFTGCNSQIKNAKTEAVKIYGNCDMCKSNIEKSGNVHKVANVNWDENTKMAEITYDATQTNQDEILKRIALSGYDSDKFLAPDDAYAALAECCRYERVKKTAIKTEISKTEIQDHSKHSGMTDSNQEVSQLKTVFDNYFAVKDALVNTDGNTASAKAKELLTAINAVKMETLKSDEHTVWMKVMKELASDAGRIAETTDAGQQRKHFTTLSKNMYELIKVSKPTEAVYYQHCPMFNEGKGANWLSKENEVKNPYYGSQMLTCGKTVETIK